MTNMVTALFRVFALPGSSDVINLIANMIIIEISLCSFKRG